MFYFTSYTICYLWVLSVQHTVKNNLDNETKTLHHHYMGYSFRLAARNLFVIKESFCKKGTFISTIPHTESTYHGLCYPRGARCSSMVEHSLMVRWVVGLILHGVDALSYFSFQPEHHDWCNKGWGMCNPVCGMVHIKEPLLLIGKSSPC